MKMSLRDHLKQVYLDFKNRYRYKTSFAGKGTDFQMPIEYFPVMDEDFSNPLNFNWDIPGPAWEQPYHPDQLWQWYDKDMVTPGTLEVALRTRYKPKIFPGVSRPIEIAVGMMKSNKKFKYGIFTFRAMLPVGRSAWPAIWLSGTESWPPEIDIVEAWSENTFDYYYGKNITSNVHYQRDGEHKQIGSRQHALPAHRHNIFNEYVLWWEREFIRIYYNGHLVREVTTKRILDKIAQPMEIIIDSWIDSSGLSTGQSNPFKLTNVSVYQKYPR